MVNTKVVIIFSSKTKGYEGKNKQITFIPFSIFLNLS